jgi:hypothetical protein
MVMPQYEIVPHSPQGGMVYVQLGVETDEGPPSSHPTIAKKTTKKKALRTPRP